jgi:hypothetical protein
MYFVQHCFICRPSDSTVSEDVGIEPRTVATVRRSSHSATSHLIYIYHFYQYRLFICINTLWSKHLLLIQIPWFERTCVQLIIRTFRIARATSEHWTNRHPGGHHHQQEQGDLHEEKVVPHHQQEQGDLHEEKVVPHHQQEQWDLHEEKVVLHYQQE